MAFRKTFALAIAGASMLATSPAGAVNLIADGGFEGIAPDNFEVYNAGSTMGAWTVIDSPGEDGGPPNNVLLLGSTYSEGALTFNPQEGNFALDLTGAGNTGLGVGIEQTIATTIGIAYNLSFWLGNASATSSPQLEVYALPSIISSEPPPAPNFVAFNAATTPNAINWQRFSYNFVADSTSTTIRFRNRTLGDNYAGLDNVVLGIVPEPATWAMMLVGFGAVGYAFRRRPKYRTVQAV